MSTLKKMRLLIPALSALIAAQGAAAQSAGAPNVVIFLADDTGWNDVGFHNPKIRTPNLDRLAREGVELDRYYAYPTCSPTRVALLTGRPPSRFGIHAPIAGRSEEALPRDVPTLASVLRARGYHTAITGKWHLGLTPEVGPNSYGFEHAYGFLHGQVDPYTHLYKNGDITWHRNGKFITEAGHATDLIEREAVRFVREVRDRNRPFFLYVPFSVPHYPLDEPYTYVRPYEKTIENEWQRRNAAAMTHMDAAIGKILAALDQEGVRRNTLVIFASDNGGQQSWTDTEEEYGGRFPDHHRLGDNTPLRGWKGELYEGGIRVPAVASWPGRLSPRKVTEPMIVHDLFRTITTLAGVESRSIADAEGIDVWPALRGEGTLPERTLYWRAPKAQAVRIGDWKLLHDGAKLAEGKYELFHLGRDPLEKRELSREEPKRVEAMRAELARQLARDL